MKKILKVRFNFFYRGPKMKQNLYINLIPYFALIPTICFSYDNHWGLAVDFIVFFWNLNLRFYIVDLDAVREAEELAEREREKYNQRKE